MKKFFTLLLISSLTAAFSFAAVRTAVTGNWHVSTAASNTAWGGLSLTTTADTLIIPNGVTVTVVSANVTCGALIVETGGTLTFQSSSSRNVVVASGGGYFGTVTINGTVAMANSNGQFIQWNGPSFTVGSGSNWTWAGTSSGTDGGINYAGTTNTTIFGNGKTIGRLRITGAGGTVTLNGNINFRGQGTTGPCITLGTSTSNLIVPTGTTLTLSANGSSTNDFSITSGGKITLNGTAVLDNRAGTTGTIAGAGAITLNGTSTYIHNHTGSTLIGGVASTVSYGSGTTCEIRGLVGATSFAAGSQTFHHFIWNCSGQTSGCNFSGSLTTVNGNLDIRNTNNQNLRFTGNTALTLNVGGDLNISALNGASRLDMCNGTGAPIVNVTGNVLIGGNSNNAFLLSTNTSTLRTRGNWTNGTNGTFTSANTTVEFNATAADQTITKTTAETFNTLVINNTFGGTGVTASNGVSASALTLTAGKLTANATVTSTGGLTTGGATNYVVGSLTRAVAAGVSSPNFPIGDAGNYTPVSFAFGAGNTAGNVTVSTTVPGVPPASGTPPSGPGLSTAQYIDRSWTVTSTIGTPEYAATFTYIDPADIEGGANTSNLIVARNNGGTWSNPGVATSVSPSVTTVGGQTTFGTFHLGESAACTSNTFSGTGDWTDGTKWSCGAPPDAGDDITIAAGANITLNTNFTIAGTFVMNATSSMTVNVDRTLTISGSANFNSQSVTFKSDATGYGSLGQVTGSLTNANNVTVERFIPNVGFRSWRLLSVPTSGSQTIRQSWQENQSPMVNGGPAGFGTLITGGGNNTGASQALGFDFSGPNTSMLSWNGSAWANIPGTLGALSAQNAYFLYVRGDRGKTVTGLTSDAGSTTLRSNGTIYTGNQVINAFTTYSLIPNLYPSAINFTLLDRSGVGNNFTIWDSKTQIGNQLGRYVTFAGAVDFEPNIGTVSYPASVGNWRIESGQAFFVNGGAGATITLKEIAKLSDSANGNLGLRPVKRASLRATLSDDQADLDGTVAVFDASFANAVNEDDAQKMGNPGANFGIETAAKILSVEGRQPAAENDVVQFRMWNLGAGNYSLKLDAGNIAKAGVEALLEDNYTRIITPVQLNGSTTVSFSITADAASKAANRFRLVFRKGISGVEGTPAISIAPNPVTGGMANLKFSNQPEGRYSVRVMSLNGQVLLNRVVVHPGGSSNQQLNLGSRFASGNYRLEVISPAKVRTVQNLLIKN